MMKGLIAILIMLMSTVGPAIVIAAAAYSSITALGRNPTSAPKIMLAMIVSFIFAMGISVISLLVVFQVFTP